MFLLCAPLAFGLGCESVRDLRLGNTTITVAERVAAGGFQQPGATAGKGKQNNAFLNLPAFCRVTATLTPSSDSQIQIEVWMPEARWNANLQSVGNGAWAGTISYPAMATALAEGFATASTDTGHAGGNAANFIPGHPEKVIDFSYRAIHEMTVAAKRIIEANYGRPATKSYFNGCSTGGRQALTEVQRYPADYDGIIAGAAANYATHLHGGQVWTAAIANKDPATVIPAAKFALLHEAALKACDGRDGVKDGVIENPLKCNFDPKVLLCKGTDAPTCLTGPQVETAQLTYAGPKDARGNSLFPGMEPGSEAGWATLSGARPLGIADDTYRLLVFQDANWDYRTFEAARDIARATRDIGPLMDSTDPNLRPFFFRGGKLLMYHGWADPGIAPRNSVNYYNSVVKTVGKNAAADEIRLFMVPGMGHCGGGDGTSTFNAMAALTLWVEQGHAPDSIPASRVRNGQTDRTRPLCPFPQVAKYDGVLDTNDAKNFSCVTP
ncbi:MAG: tannase/feruloyl esterase family alpha/beta hydrolase [Bryobacteraceae bacterium]